MLTPNLGLLGVDSFIYFSAEFLQFLFWQVVVSHYHSNQTEKWIYHASISQHFIYCQTLATNNKEEVPTSYVTGKNIQNSQNTYFTLEFIFSHIEQVLNVDTICFYPC